MAGAIQGLYSSVEPVVAYGVDLASWAAGWVQWLLPPLPPILSLAPMGLSTLGLDLAALAPNLLLAPGTDLGLGALTTVADTLTGSLGDLLLSLLG